MIPPHDASTGLERLPGKLPIASIPQDVDLQAVASKAVDNLASLTADSFTAGCLWRDQLAFTGTFRTLYGAKRVFPTWQLLSKRKQPIKFSVQTSSVRIAQYGMENLWIEARFTFETTAGGLSQLCSGIINLVPGESESDDWKIWALYTTLQQFKGHEAIDMRATYPGHAVGEAQLNGLSINGTTNGHVHDNVTRLDVIIIGAGQCGLSAAGHVKSLGMKAIVFERNKKVGDNWTERYESLILHTSHRFNDLPFGPTWNLKDHQEWLSTKDLAKGYQDFVKRFGLDVWCSSNITSCIFDHDKREWTMKVERNGETHTVIGKHVILGTGPGGTIPIKPHWPGEESFEGTVMHSVDWKSAKPWAGKNGIVIGTANTGHDVAENMLDAGLSTITMVQRNPTYVIPRDYMSAMLNLAWPENRDSDLSDEYFWSTPNAISRQMCYNFFDPLFEKDREEFKALDDVGFKTDCKGDFIDHLLVRFGGHYMDHGASDKIRRREIKAKSDSAIVGYTPKGLEFADGSVLEADVIVLATGFHKDVFVSTSNLLGAKVAKQIGDYWGLDEEGELIGAFKPCGHPNVWMTGGGCAHARYFTRLVALQIKADILGQPLEVYTDTVAEN